MAAEASTVFQHAAGFIECDGNAPDVQSSAATKIAVDPALGTFLTKRAKFDKTVSSDFMPNDNELLRKMDCLTSEVGSLTAALASLLPAFRALPVVMDSLEAIQSPLCSPVCNSELAAKVTADFSQAIADHVDAKIDALMAKVDTDKTIRSCAAVQSAESAGTVTKGLVGHVDAALKSFDHKLDALADKVASDAGSDGVHRHFDLLRIESKDNMQELRDDLDILGKAVLRKMPCIKKTVELAVQTDTGPAGDKCNGVDCPTQIAAAPSALCDAAFSASDGLQPCTHHIRAEFDVKILEGVLDTLAQKFAQQAIAGFADAAGSLASSSSSVVFSDDPAQHAEIKEGFEGCSGAGETSALTPTLLSPCATQASLSSVALKIPFSSPRPPEVAISTSSWKKSTTTTMTSSRPPASSCSMSTEQLPVAVPATLLVSPAGDSGAVVTDDPGDDCSYNSRMPELGSTCDEYSNILDDPALGECDGCGDGSAPPLTLLDPAHLHLVGQLEFFFECSDIPEMRRMSRNQIVIAVASHRGHELALIGKLRNLHGDHSDFEIIEDGIATWPKTNAA